MKSLRVFAVALIFIGVEPAVAQSQITDDQIAKIIVQASRDAYYRTGHPCACPDDLARNGSRCGGRRRTARKANSGV